MDNLTILLTVKDRFNHSIAWLKYMIKDFSKVNVLIADGSLKNDLADFLSTFELPESWAYFRYQPDLDISFYYSKIYSSLKLVKTEYVLMADNDDFYEISAIQTSLNFLTLNSDYIAARGSLINFNPNILGWKGVRAIKYISPSIDFDDINARLNFFLKNIRKYDYYANWYCVIRTNSLLQFWECVHNLENDIITQEILFHFYILNSGKVKIFNQEMYFRDLSSSQCGNYEVLKFLNPDYKFRILLQLQSTSFTKTLMSRPEIFFTKWLSILEQSNMNSFQFYQNDSFGGKMRRSLVQSNWPKYYLFRALYKIFYRSSRMVTVLPEKIQSVF
jgi:glycosyltransferase domain-containing protein